MTGCRCLIPVSLGELLDKITILEIKVLHLRGEGLAHGIQELSLLRQVLGDLAFPVEQERFSDLKSINQSLWTIEDAIRDKERQGQFDAEFVELARQVYLQNDRRAALKRQINQAYGSELCEEKAYASYAS
ncbi:MAG: DUF6165 family protein [Cyanobium sp. LacPavin_0920_WC12_MAG_62_9]|nr:DUF6165 family protein [Cyanobium sp. LacPavin_0920_WC12_MAG_62_9]